MISGPSLQILLLAFATGYLSFSKYFKYLHTDSFLCFVHLVSLENSQLTPESLAPHGFLPGWCQQTLKYISVDAFGLDNFSFGISFLPPPFSVTPLASTYMQPLMAGLCFQSYLSFQTLVD